MKTITSDPTSSSLHLYSFSAFVVTFILFRHLLSPLFFFGICW
ncbi:unnamed protein product [Penicillium salamii]|nr:unnamed protein product [Penicillium salamii]